MAELRVLKEQGRRTRAKRLTFTPRVVCPAARLIYETPEGTAVRCTVEENTISALRDPTALFHLCCADYQLCSSWELEKKRIEHNDRSAIEDKAPVSREEFQKLVQVDKNVPVTHFYRD